MKISPRVYRSTGLLIATVVVGLGAGAVRPDVRDEQQRPVQQQSPKRFRHIGYTPEEIREYQGPILRDLLAVPCDSIPAPFGNESHDCQRVVQDGGQAFGALVGIYPDLQVLQQREEFFDQARVVAYVTNAGGARAVGEHYVDNGYGPLGIGRNPNPGSTVPAQFCLWLVRGRERAPGGEVVVWRAAMMVNREFDQREGLGCRTQPTARDWSLEVTRRSFVGNDAEDYPATARWMWTRPRNREEGEHYIAVRCGPAQCDIARAGVELLSDAEVGGVAGWHDAQFLGIPVDSVYDTLNLRPGPWGEIHPGTPPSADASVPAVVERPAAIYRLYGEPGPYLTKLKLVQYGIEWTSEVWIDIPTTVNPLTGRVTVGTPSGEYRDIGGAVTEGAKAVQVSRLGHGPHGSARWRWRPRDESGWVPCYHFGCCDVDPGD